MLRSRAVAGAGRRAARRRGPHARRRGVHGPGEARRRRRRRPRTRRGGRRRRAALAVVAAILNAAQSPPFMTSKRIVVVHDYEQLQRATRPRRSPRCSPTRSRRRVLVFVTGGGRAPRRSSTRSKARRDRRPRLREDRRDVLAAELERARPHASTATRPARRRSSSGEDAGRVPPSSSSSSPRAFGPAPTLDADDVEPYLGEAGSVPGYQLTNAIEDGKIAAGALDPRTACSPSTSARQPKPMHPLQVLGMLQSRYRKLLRARRPGDPHAEGRARGARREGQHVPGAEGARGVARRSARDGLRQAVDSLHQADLDLKGASAMPEDAVLEVLVARLAALARPAAGGSRRGASASAASVS